MNGETSTHVVQHKPVVAAVVKKGGLFDGDDEDEYGAEAQPKQEEEVQEEVYVEEEQVQVQQEQVVEEFVYYDPVKKVKFSFDPITLEARIEEDNFDWET